LRKNAVIPGATDPDLVPDNTPILIGAGQYVAKLDSDQPPLESPVELASHAARAALASSGTAINGSHVDTIAFIRLFSDSAAAWACPFGRSNNPPESVASRIGAQPLHRIYSNVGGTQPLQLMREICRDIARGEKQLALLCGAEAIANQRYAMKQGLQPDWNENFDQPMDEREYVQRFATEQELASGMSLPAHYYALIENRQAAQQGRGYREHRRAMAQLMAPFSEVAAANPYSQKPQLLTAEQLSEPTADDYPISLPYSKKLVAQDAVNQAAAIVLCSVGKARELGIPADDWVFLASYAEADDIPLLLRTDPASSTAMDRALQACMEDSGLQIDDIDEMDIYSCFPCAVQAACDTLDIKPEPQRALTVTGGLPYFGGPGNNYSMHALAEITQRLQAKGGNGLVTANGGILSKHAGMVLSATPVIRDWGTEQNKAIEESDIAASAICDAPSTGSVISYTVIHQRDKPDRSVVLAESAQGERFLARSDEQADADEIMGEPPIGRSIEVKASDAGHRFRFSP
jgi:acetyl-CoA C-acetyltransferase